MFCFVFLTSTVTVTPSVPRTLLTGIRGRRSLRYIGDIRTPDLETPRRRRQCIQLVRYETKVMRAKLRALEKQNKSLKRKVQNLNDVLDKLRKENMLSDDKMTELLVRFLKFDE
jgi:predicted RNase H-like nuclease (RuvC/YqgF family)